MEFKKLRPGLLPAAVLAAGIALWQSAQDPVRFQPTAADSPSAGDASSRGVSPASPDPASPELRKLLDPTAARDALAGARAPLTATERETLAAEMLAGARRLKQRLAAGDVAGFRAARRDSGQRGVVPSQQEAIDELLARLGPNARLEVDGVSGTLRYLRGDLSPVVADSANYAAAQADGDAGAKALATAELLARLLRIRSPRDEFTVARTATDDLGMTHVLLQQTYADAPIWGAHMGVHFGPDGNPVEISGVYTATPVDLRIPQNEIRETEALRRAKDAVGMGDAEGLVTPKLQRILYWDRDKTPVLCYRVELTPAFDASWHVFVDAGDGRIVHRYNAATAAATTGTANDVFGQAREIDIWQEGGTYYCVNTATGFYDVGSSPPDFQQTTGAVFVYDAMQQDISEGARLRVVSSDNPNAWDDAAVSVSYGISTTIDYYRSTHQRNSLDGNGMNVLSVVHVGNGMDNAFWAPRFQGLFFGDGSGTVFDNLPGALDVVAHEFTHGVVSHTAGLIYENQSGAMNEFYADFMGAMVDREDWLIGEDIVVQAGKIALRDMAQPDNPDVLNPLPATMSEYRHMPVTEDNGGVHINVGILNRMSYLLAEDPGYGIGRDKAEDIFYRALTQYLTPRAQFIDLRRAAVSAATDLYGADSPEVAAVGSAFDAVEIHDGHGSAPPSEAPVGDGIDQITFLEQFYDWYYGVYYYSMLLLDADGQVSPIANYVSETRPAISGDGKWGLYVDAYGNVWWTDGANPEQWTTNGLARSIALSKSLRYIAYTTSDFAAGITIIDTQTEQSTEIPLQVPSPDGAPLILDYADVLTFNFAGDQLAFDAVAHVREQDGAEVPIWGIYGIRVADGSLQQLVPQAPGTQLGNPMFSHTRDYHMLADQVVTDGQQTQLDMMAVDLHRMTTAVLIPQFVVLAQSSYHGSDTKAVFRSYSTTYQTYTVGTIDFTEDGLAVDDDSVAAAYQSYNVLAYPVGLREYAGTYEAPTGAIQVAESLQFDDTPVGGQNVLNLVVQNTGAAGLEVFEMLIGGADEANFAHSGLPQNIPAGDSIVIPVTFSPREERGHSASLTLRSTDPVTPTATVALAGAGTAGAAVNQPPSFVKGPNQEVSENAGEQTVPGWATQIDPGAPGEADQVLTFTVEVDRPDLFTVAPAILADGTLSYAPNPTADGGTVTATVTLHDNGGTENGGQDTSAPQTFTLVVLDEAPADNDADGVPDAWETSHCGDLRCTADDDLDGDGRTLIQEWQDGTDPLGYDIALTQGWNAICLTGPVRPNGVADIFTGDPAPVAPTDAWQWDTVTGQWNQVAALDTLTTYYVFAAADATVSVRVWTGGRGGREAPYSRADSDMDGLDDDWETNAFGNLRFTGDDDPDGDGRTNTEEAAAQTDPGGYDIPILAGWNARALAGVIDPNGVTELFGSPPDSMVAGPVYQWNNTSKDYDELQNIPARTPFWAFAESASTLRVFPRVNTDTTPANRPPQVSLTAPQQGENFEPPATVTFQVTAADPDGAVTRVQFFNGDQLLGEDTTDPYSFTWENVPAGDCQVRAKAIDDGLAATTTPEVGITIRSTQSGQYPSLISNAFELPFAVTALGENGVATAAEAVFGASELNGGTVTLTGTLVQSAPESETWTYAGTPTDALHVVYHGAPAIEITFHEFDPGYEPSSWESLRDSHRSLDFTAEIEGQASLRIHSNAYWQYDSDLGRDREYVVRTLVGTVLANGENWTVNLSQEANEGAYVESPFSYSDWHDRVSGNAESPTTTMTVDNYAWSTYSYNGNETKHTNNRQVGTNSTITTAGVQYTFDTAWCRWEYVSAYVYDNNAGQNVWLPNTMHEPDYWHAQGILRADATQIGTFTFDGPLTPYTKGPDFILRLDHGPEHLVNPLVPQ